MSKTEIKLDLVVEANRALLHERSQLGIKKYGTTLGDANLSRKELLRHGIEEALDLANYLQAEIMREDQQRSIDREEVRKTINEEFDKFFVFTSEDKTLVTSVSCRFFSEHIYDILKKQQIKK